MRTCAQIGEIPLLVEGDGLALISVLLAQLYLVRFALFLEILYSFVGSHGEVFKTDRLLDDLLHFCFDLCQCFGGERLLGVEIIVESVFDSRTDGKLCCREKALHSLRQNVGGGVVERSLTLFVLKCEELHGAAISECGSQIADLAVDLCGTCGLCFAQLSCSVERGQLRVEFLCFAICQCYFYHTELPFLAELNKSPAVQC